MQLYIEGLCHGNILEEEAINISTIFKSYFPVEALPFEMRHKEHVMCLPSSADLCIDAKVKNKLEPNSVIEVIEGWFYFCTSTQYIAVARALNFLDDVSHRDSS